MAKTETQNVPDELRNLFQKSVEQRDRFILGVAQGHKRLLSDRERKLLKRTASINSPQVGRGSMFKFFSPMWRALTTEQKQVWKDAAVFSALSGWQLFVSDNAERARASLEFGVPPSDLWQVRGGRILIESPASEILLSQAHPLNYLVTQKIRGRAWKEEVIAVQEGFALPLEIQIRYKSDLTAEGGTQRARYYASVWSSYQGQDIRTILEIPFSLSVDWTYGTASLSEVIGHVIGYTLYLDIFGYRGELLYDNIRAIHSGQNWARDPRCDDVSRTFNNGFASVAPFWVRDSFPAGVQFASLYPPAL